MVVALPLLVTALITAAPEEQARTRSYEVVKQDVERARQNLAAKYRAARSERARGVILDQAAQVVLTSLEDEILPAWHGTPWAFYGLSNEPRQGAIACGTFVGTVLKHAGFRIDRVAMGRLASEHIALSLTGAHNLRRYRNRPVDEVEGELLTWGRGLYMIGLDTHAALAIVDRDGVAHFIHSSYYPPSTVVDEPLQGDNPFADSRYRVVAKLLDRKMMDRWLRGRPFKATKPRRVRSRTSGAK